MRNNIYDKSYFTVIKDMVRNSVTSHKDKWWYLRHGSPAWKMFWKEINGAYDYLKDCDSAKDAEDALELMRLYTDSPRPEAKTLYGSVLMFNDKPWYNPDEGLRMLREGAENAGGEGYTGAWCMFLYGLDLLTTSHGHPKNENEARKWMEKSATQGLSDARRFIKLYWKGSNELPFSYNRFSLTMPTIALISS